MAQAKIFTGARAQLIINGKTVGLFSNCSWSIRQGKEPAFILGRYHPGEITPTFQDAVRMNLTGYRVVEAGPYAVASATLLRDLLTENDFSIAVRDRQTGKIIFKADGCRVEGWNSGAAARGVSDLRVDVIGIKGEDEFGTAAGGDDDTTATNLLDGAPTTA